MKDRFLRNNRCCFFWALRFDGAGQGRKEIALIFNEYHDSGGHRYIQVLCYVCTLSVLTLCGKI